MPYCEACDRFYNPNTLDSTGDCPEGHHVADPDAPAPPPRAPWHFKVMLALLIIYLVWRLTQLLTGFF